MTTIHNFSNISEALEQSDIIGVKKIGAAIYVRRDCWAAAFQEIQELCACRFTSRRIHNNTGLSNSELNMYVGEPMALNLGRESRTEILFSKVCHCHRSGSYIPQREDRPHQKRSKKVNCPGKITIQCFRYNPGRLKKNSGVKKGPVQI
ncbi:hypothetical protein [Absidia glauca]|uniref:Uncharacterized protein n=1 Tax=Absidia glauca TaxID=4829 RepID=A0A168L6L1_ABSGL|nr:hypothetical protein [Absidia glauca]